MDETNYFSYLQKLEELEALRDSLLLQKKQQQLREKQEQLRDLRNQYRGSVAAITESCNFLVTHKKDLETIAKNENEDYISMPSASVQILKQTMGLIKVVMQYSDSADAKVELDDAKTCSFIKSAKKQAVDLQEMNNNCNALLADVNTLLSNDENQAPTDEAMDHIISSNNKQRQRRSVLSESSFMNTFQMNNVSASSPIANRSTCSNTKETPNLIPN